MYDDQKVSLNEQLQNVEKHVGSKYHKELEKKAAGKSVTLVKNDNNMLPMKLENNKRVVVIDYSYKQSSMYGDFEWNVNSDSILESMEKILSEQDLKNVDLELSPINIEVKFDDNFNAVYDYTKDLTKIFKKIDEADYVILAPYMALPGVPWYQELEGLQELDDYPAEIIDYINSKNKNYVCLNVREPYGIAYMENAKSIISVYANLGGDMAAGFDETIRLANIEAGLKVVFGINEPQGKLPIDVRKDGESNIQYPVGYGLKFN